MRAVEATKQQREDGNTVDNRVLWTHAAHAAPHGSRAHAAFDAYEPLRAWYCSIMDGTGSVERYLAAHKAFLEAHCGGNGVGDDAELCLEIQRDGPQDEEAWFVKDDRGHASFN